MWNPYDFTGKKIIVTGATSGIGRATAIRLSEQGAVVVMLGRSGEKLKETLALLTGGGHRIYVKDFAEPGGYKEMFDDIVSDGRKIDGLVHSAGMAKILPLSSFNHKNMDESMTVNFYSFVEMVGLLSKKKYHNNASIVGISSVSVRYPQKCQGLYIATKAAMNAYMTSAAMELASAGIRINTVLPSNTKTRMFDEAVQDKTPEQLKAALAQQVLGFAEPADIADIVCFLLSDASRMITGREIYADGGFINFIPQR